MDEKIIKKCIEARHKLHQLAELSNDEIQTKIFLMEFLKKNSCLEIHDEGKWFYAVYKSKERGPGIAFRSEIDAVPVAETTDVVYKSLTDGEMCIRDRDELNRIFFIDWQLSISAYRN